MIMKSIPFFLLRSLFPALMISLVFTATQATAVNRSFAGDIQQKLNRATELQDAFQDEEALAAYKAVLEIDPAHYDALWNTVMLHTSIGHRQSNTRMEEQHYDQAYNYAKQLLEKHPDQAGTHFAYAAAVGRKAQSVGARERISMSNEIRDHAYKAVELDPEYARAWNVLGNWHHRAANLSTLERMAANALFGGAPKGASNEKALESFNRALELDPDFILYYHDKADFLITVGDKEEARRTIQKGLEKEIRTSDDERWKDYMRTMLSRL